MAKSRVSITIWKTWKGSRHYTHRQYGEFTLSSILKKVISTFQFSTDYFFKRNSNPFFPVIPYVIETLVKVWKSSKQCGEILNLSKGVYVEEGQPSWQDQPSLPRFRVSVNFFVKIYFRLYERRASPPWRDLAIDYPRSRLGGLGIFHINALGQHLFGELFIFQVLLVYVQVIKLKFVRKYRIPCFVEK